MHCIRRFYCRLIQYCYVCVKRDYLVFLFFRFLYIDNLHFFDLYLVNVNLKYFPNYEMHKCMIWTYLKHTSILLVKYQVTTQCLNTFIAFSNVVSVLEGITIKYTCYIKLVFRIQVNHILALHSSSETKHLINETLLVANWRIKNLILCGHLLVQVTLIEIANSYNIIDRILKTTKMWTSACELILSLAIYIGLTHKIYQIHCDCLWLILKCINKNEQHGNKK